MKATHKMNYKPWPSGLIPEVQGWFNKQKSTNVTQQIKTIKDQESHDPLNRSKKKKSIQQNSMPFHDRNIHSTKW